MECKFCGQQYEEKEIVCPACGKAPDAEATVEEIMDAMPQMHNEMDRIQEVREKAENRKKRTIIGVIVIAVLFACLAAGWGALYYVQNQRAEQEAALRENPPISGVPGEAVTKMFGENFVDVLITDEASAQTALEQVKSQFGIVQEDVSFRLIRQIKVAGDTYYRFVQTCGGLDVYGGEIVIAAAGDGTPLALFGTCIGTDGLDLSANIKPGKASNAISRYVDKMIEEYCVTEGINVTQPQKTICNFEGKTYLAYMANISGYNAKGTYVAFDVFVDADAGTGIFLQDTCSYEKTEEATEGVLPINVQPEQEGEVSPVLSEGDTYTIYTVNDKFNWNDQTRPSALDAIPMEEIEAGNASAFVAGTKTAVDQAYYYFKDNFGFEGLDGSGGAFRVYLNANEYVEDRLPPEKALYQDDILMFIQKDLTTNSVDKNVVMHEYAHGVMWHIAELSGTMAKNENAIIAEGLADIFGELAEGTAPDWVHADRTFLEEKTGYFTKLSGAVQATQVADCYRYSMILSHAAYRMYADGIGTKKLGQLYFRTLCLLTKNSGFSDFCSALELSAKRMTDTGVLSNTQYSIVKNALLDTQISFEHFVPVVEQKGIEDTALEDEMLTEAQEDPNEKIIE